MGQLCSASGGAQNLTVDIIWQTEFVRCDVLSHYEGMEDDARRLCKFMISLKQHSVPEFYARRKRRWHGTCHSKGRCSRSFKQVGEVPGGGYQPESSGRQLSLLFFFCRVFFG
jgi:hypothetical protein